MDPVTLITIIAIVSVIAVIVLFSKRRDAGIDEEYDEDEYDEDENYAYGDDFDEDSDEHYEYEEVEDETDEDADEDDDLYEVEEAPFESYKATVAGMDIERNPTGTIRTPSSQLDFLVEFKIQRSRNKSEVITLEVPEDIYEDIKLGENALLVMQNGNFIDFGDRYAEDAPEDAIAEAIKANEAKSTKKADPKKKK